MSTGFQRFKRKLRRNAWIKSLILGISCGTLAAAGVILRQKLSTLSPNPLLYLPIGVGVALVVALVAFLVLRPSEQKIAKKLDEDLGLGEKVQTMLAYQGEDSAMLRLQREDADQRLIAADVRAVKYKHQWKHIFAPLLAAALMVVAVITPIKAAEPPEIPEEPPFELSNWQETALLELIEEVKASKMESVPKQAVVSELERLLSGLKVTDKASEMKAMVIGGITNINRIARETNSNAVLSAAMSLSEHASVSGMAMSMDMLSGLEAREALTDAREALRVDEVSQPLAAYIDAMDTMLDLTELDDSDALYSALDALVTSLTEIHGQLGQYTRDWAQAQLDTAFATASEEVSDALQQQYINQNTADTTVLRLMEIFDISADELPADEQPVKLPTQNEEDQRPEEDEENEGPGGLGDGDVLYGSDDMIYDPAQNQYVKYGDVINEYFAGVTEKILDGNISDALEQFISDYFATLYDGSEKEEAD